jgi:hypothetical protein
MMLAKRIEEAANAAGIAATVLIAECVAQHLEVALRHRVLMDRIEVVDQGLLELATFLGEATAGGSSVDLANVCQYARSNG